MAICSRPQSEGADKEQLLAMYRRMMLVRHFEQKVSLLFLQGHIPGTIHLSLGQEAVAVGVGSTLREDDVLIPTHRGHGHALAKGMEPRALFAELLARRTGCSRGKGGSLHIGDVSKGIYPANPVVGSSVPVAAGIAFAFKYQGVDRVVASFFGEGAVNTGPWHEGINLAAIWSLPIVFILENNQYAISTQVRTSTRLERLVERAHAYGIPGAQVDGNDVVAVYQAALEAVERARCGEGPMLVECITYRIGGHKRDDAATYRPKEEVEAWRQRDPIPRLRRLLVEQMKVTKETVGRIETEVLQELDAAARQALADPAPDADSVMEDVYA
jgi:TPP-dependent pyruvate/acetoin dehydrogenase alpha subunit